MTKLETARRPPRTVIVEWTPPPDIAEDEELVIEDSATEGVIWRDYRVRKKGNDEASTDESSNEPNAG